MPVKWREMPKPYPQGRIIVSAPNMDPTVAIYDRQEDYVNPKPQWMDLLTGQPLIYKPFWYRPLPKFVKLQLDAFNALVECDYDDESLSTYRHFFDEFTELCYQEINKK